MDAESRCSGGFETCRDTGAALRLKIAAIAAILVACVVGFCIPILGKSYQALRAESNFFFVIKSFAAGVILATGFVHMLPDAFAALTNPCLGEVPWNTFPFVGFVAMLAALFTLLIDFWATAYYQRRHGASEKAADEAITTDITGGATEATDSNTSICADDEKKGKVLSTVGNHPRNHLHSEDSDEHCKLRHKVIAQVLELGIVAHSVIIGISMGTSQSPCTIRPLIAAFTFHQFFEGVALGGCISQANFRSRSAALMCFFFFITTPSGIGIGIGIASVYNEHIPKALIVEGLFDSMSAGILIYMSLVDLIASDLLSKRLQGDKKLQVLSYLSLFLGSAAMSVIARWS